MADYKEAVKAILSGDNLVWLSAEGELSEGVRIIRDALLTDELQAAFLSVVDGVPPPPPPPPVEEPETFVVAANNGLNIRPTPNTKQKAIGTVRNGATVVVQGKYKDTVSGYTFTLLVSIDGLKQPSGYVAREFLKPVPPPPPTKPPSVFKGFGPHFLNGQYDATVARKYPVVKVMDNPGALVAAHADNPDRLFIHRRFNKAVDNPAKFIEDNGGATNAALTWFEMYKADFEQCPFAYHEGPCEAGVSTALIDFEYERTRILADKGYKACVLNLGVGQTFDALWTRADVVRLVQLVQRTGGAIGLHCYAEGVMSAYTGAGYWQDDGTWSLPGNPLPATIDPLQSYLALRIVRDQQILNGLGLYPQLIATELGLDDCYSPDNGVKLPRGIKVRGWRSCTGVWQSEGWLKDIDANNFYLKQLQWWCDQTGLPGCVYAHGDATEWNGIPGVFDTVGLL